LRTIAASHDSACLFADSLPAIAAPVADAEATPITARIAAYRRARDRAA
jgi:hypothetical protein